MSVWASLSRGAANLAKRKTQTVVIVLAAALAGWADRGRAVEVHDEDPFRVSVAVSPRVLARRGVDVPVVIVTLDGVRWQEIFEGTEPARSPGYVASADELLPNLYKLGIERGAFVGAPGRGVISASGPNYISLPGYTEILSGRSPSLCRDNLCPRTSSPTLLDEARAAGAKVAVFSSWERIALAATPKPDAFLLSCGRNGDRTIDPWPGHDDYRPDRVTAEAALAYYEAEQPDVFFLGLGDTDEFAHRGDYAGYVEALRRADQVIGRLVTLLDRTERGRRTHIVVTADHGRARTFHDHGRMPEAARVWMIAAGPRFAARGAVVTSREHYLADIAPTLRVVLGLGADVSERAGGPIAALFEETPLGLR